MKMNENKWQKSHAAWKLLRQFFHRCPIVDGPLPDDSAAGPPERPVDPLDRIQEHLCRHGLDRQVRVRHETGRGGFVLEDDDGVVHAEDFTAAVAVIDQMWLHQP